MPLPDDFQFTENADVNRFATESAVLMFGKDWRNVAGMVVRHPAPNSNIVSHNQSGWELKVYSVDKPAIYAVGCLKNDSHENPSENIPAVVRFRADGCPLYYAHYSKGNLINTPDGSPAQVNYKDDGTLGECWYVDANGRKYSEPASPEEIASRMASTHHAAIQALCSESQAIVALSSGKGHTPSPSRPPDHPLNGSR